MLNFQKLLMAVVLGAVFSPASAAGKDVTLAVASTFTSLDPYDANDTLSQAAAKSFYQGLFSFDKDQKRINVLAESFEANKDATVYTIKLKKGVKFHDGTDFDANAVKVTFDRVTNPDNKLKRFNLYSGIAKTEVVDAHTVRFTLKKPFSAFINQLAHPSGVIISPTALKKYGKDIGFNPVGTGPFKFVEWKQTDYLKVAKFDGYWKKGYPKVDTLIWRPVIESGSRAAMIQTGEADFVFPLPLEQTDLLKTKANLDVLSTPSIVLRYVTINTRAKPFDDVRVRQALNYAVNKQAFAKVAYSGYASPAEGVVPQGVEYAVKMQPWPYDPKKARELIKAAGYPNGFETTLWSATNNTNSQKAIQFLQQQFAQVGIKTKIQALESGQRVAMVEGVQKPEDAQVKLYYYGWSSSTGEADWALRPLLATESMPPKMVNMSYYSNPKVDAALHGALERSDVNAKAALYQQAQELVWADAPWIFLTTDHLLYARAKKLDGIYVMPDGSFNLEEISVK
ncbi:MAG: glutathione ABC transporter substrate-binding protein GsiB [Burkholderiaceae bacterium]